MGLQSLGTLARVERETAEQKESEQQQALNSGGTPSSASTAAATGASGSGPAGSSSSTGGTGVGGSSGDSGPHLGTRRYAELACALTLLQAPLASPGRPDESLVRALENLRQALVRELVMVADRRGGQAGRVFLINNLDLVKSIFAERRLPAASSANFQDLLRAQISQYLENQLKIYFSDLVEFVHQNESGGNQQSGGTGTDLRPEAERISKHFHQAWRGAMSSVHTVVMNSFTNFNAGIEILKQCLTQLLLYYTRFQKCLQRLGLAKYCHQYSVPNASLLQEIKLYSKAL